MVTAVDHKKVTHMQYRMDRPSVLYALSFTWKESAHEALSRFVLAFALAMGSQRPLTSLFPSLCCLLSQARRSIWACYIRGVAERD